MLCSWVPVAWDWGHTKFCLDLRDVPYNVNVSYLRSQFDHRHSCRQHAAVPQHQAATRSCRGRRVWRAVLQHQWSHCRQCRTLWMLSSCAPQHHATADLTFADGRLRTATESAWTPWNRCYHHLQPTCKPASKLALWKEFSGSRLTWSINRKVGLLNKNFKY